jgi:hypothetical protein
MTVFGWDASDYDWSRGSMNIAAAAAEGIVFFTHKATEGTRTVHAYYQRALNEARAAGIEFLGAYIVVRTPGNGGNGSVRDQVEFFLTRLDSQTPWWRSHPGFFLQVDLEHWSNSSGFVYDAVAPTYGIEACDLLHGTDKWVVLYAPKWAYGDSIGGDVPLWSSAYGTNPAARYRDAYPGDGGAGWQKYSGREPVFWQYGSRLTIGSQPTCDANAYRGTLDELRALITGKEPDMDANQARQLDDIWNRLINTGWGGQSSFGRKNVDGSPATNFSQAIEGAVQAILTGDGKHAPINTATVEHSLASLGAAVKAVQADLNLLQQGGVNLDLLAAKIAPLLPAPPTAAEVAEEIAKRLGNG